MADSPRDSATCPTEGVGDDPARRYHELWQRGPRPDLRAFLQAAAPLSPQQLLAVIVIDQQESWQRRERQPAESYLGACPALRGEPELAIEVVYREYLLRDRLGEGPTLDEYVRRFPEYEARLRIQIQLHEALVGTAAPPLGQTPPGDEEMPTASGPVPGGRRASLPDIPGYEVLEWIGQGGWGDVYKARQLGLDRLAAIKMIRPEALASAEALQRFRQEAQAVSSLRHPNIVPVYEYRERDGLPYFFAMEYMEGGDLHGRLAGSPMAARQAAALVERLASAMQHAHERGVIHRDLKPHNVLLTAPSADGDHGGLGTPKIGDFGMAKRLDQQLSLTGRGVRGSPPYMAPEQAIGQAKETGPLTDVYGLGAILYELLTARPPFLGASVEETLEQVRSQTPLPPRELQPRVPADLETICLKCLQKKPRQRYASAGALADDLRRFLGGEPIQARRQRLWERGRHWVRRRPALATLLGALVVVAAIGFPVVVALWQGAEQRRREAELARNELQEQVAFNRLSLAGVNLQANNVAGAEELLDKIGPERQGWEWRYLKRARYQGFSRPLQADSGFVTGVAFSPDGRRLASAHRYRAVKVWDPVTGQELLSLPHGIPDIPEAVAFSPDGKRLAVAFHLFIPGPVQPGRVMIWDDQGTLVATLEQDAAVHGLDLTPDGRFLATAGTDATVRLWDMAEFKNVWTSPTGGEGHTLGLESVVCNPRRAELASAGWDGTVKVWDTGGKLLRTMAGNHGPLCGLAYSHDGRHLAAGGQAGRVTIWDTATGEEVQSLTATFGWVFALAYSHDDQRLAVTGFDRRIHVWNLKTTQEVLTLQGHTDVIKALAFSADGNLLASGSFDDTVRIWDATPLAERPAALPPTLAGHTEPVSWLAFNRDGRLLATASLDGTVRLWDVETRRQLGTFTGHNTAVAAVAFSPDGEALASVSGGKALVWRRRTGEVELNLPGAFQRVAYSTDGRQLICAELGRLHLIDPGSKEITRTLRGDLSNIVDFAVSPRGPFLAAGGGERQLKVFRVDEEGRAKSPVVREHPYIISAIAYNADGSQIVSGSWDGTVQVWDFSPTEFESRQPAKGKAAWVVKHDDAITGVAFSPDGRYLAAASIGGEVSVADLSRTPATTLAGGPAAASEEPIRRVVLRGHPGTVWNLAFSPDGRYLACATGTRGRGEVWLWPRSQWAS